MLRRLAFVVLFAAAPALAVAPRRLPPPEIIPHPTAMFLASLSGDGRQEVRFKAAAMGIHFFLEEPGGVTVYRFDGLGYRKEIYLKGFTLTRAIKKYAAR